MPPASQLDKDFQHEEAEDKDPHSQVAKLCNYTPPERQVGVPQYQREAMEGVVSKMRLMLRQMPANVCLERLYGILCI